MVKKYYIIGLPSSGKTTFLAALGYVLNMSDKNAIVLSSCSDSEYINNISEQWSSCKRMEHTHIEALEEIRMKVRESGGDEYELVLPDRAGELFKKKYKSGHSEVELHTALRENEKILLFVNPALICPEPMIGNISKKYREFKKGEIISQPSETEAENGSSDSSGFALGDQAEHVELLQSILASELPSIHITIVISAWDAFMGSEEIKKPEDTLYQCLPLLWQVIESHKNTLHVSYWGISAQGGNWDDPEEKETLLNKPWQERAFAVDSDGNRINDITKILL